MNPVEPLAPVAIQDDGAVLVIGGILAAPFLLVAFLLGVDGGRILARGFRRWLWERRTRAPLPEVMIHRPSAIRVAVEEISADDHRLHRIRWVATGEHPHTRAVLEDAARALESRGLEVEPVTEEDCRAGRLRMKNR